MVCCGKLHGFNTVSFRNMHLLTLLTDISKVQFMYLMSVGIILEFNTGLNRDRFGLVLILEKWMFLASLTSGETFALLLKSHWDSSVTLPCF